MRPAVFRPRLISMPSSLGTSSSFLCFVVLLGLATLCSADEFLLITSDEQTGPELQALAGPQAKIKLCNSCKGLTLRELTLGGTNERLIVLAAHGQIDPMIAERLNNLGHAVHVVISPRQNCGGSATHTRLRLLCETLVRCFPEREQEFRSRLADVESALRRRVRIPPIRPVQCLAKPNRLEGSQGKS